MTDAKSIENPPGFVVRTEVQKAAFAFVRQADIDFIIRAFARVRKSVA